MAGRQTTRAVDVPATLESLGFGTLWSSGGFEPGLSPHFERLLAATRQLHVASGIVSIWTAAPADVGPAVAALEAAYPGRFLLGLGASHSRARAGLRPALLPQWSPTSMRSTPSTQPVPPARRVLAALGPRMLELAAARAAGAHPYFVPVEHTARAQRDPRQRPVARAGGGRRARGGS